MSCSIWKKIVNVDGTLQWILLVGNWDKKASETSQCNLHESNFAMQVKLCNNFISSSVMKK